MIKYHAARTGLSFVLRAIPATAALGVLLASSTWAVGGSKEDSDHDDNKPSARGDFGMTVQDLLHDRSEKWFGFDKPLSVPAGPGDVVAREGANASDRQFLAKGLKAHFVSRSISFSGDQISFWPNDINYRYLIVCVEQGRSGTTPAGHGGLNASVQRVHVETGKVETILHGMERCDGIRTTPWGTVLATEETGDGRAYEILDPLGTTDHWIADRASGDVRDGIDSDLGSTTVVQRQTLPTMHWEGLYVTAEGVVYAGDELRPGSFGQDTDGGALFKFVPDVPFDCTGPIGGSFPGEGGLCSQGISDLSQSPLASGALYAFSASCRERTHRNFPQIGQGCEIGNGAWVKVDALTAPADANVRGATGYYRPEDLHGDPIYKGLGRRFCWNNTGRPRGENFAETICAVDENPIGTGEIVDFRTSWTYLADGGESSGFAVATANRFVEGDARFNAFDNLDFQPHTGNVYLVEDAPFGEVFACLADGADRDIKTDGCVSVLSIRDPRAEPTGFVFDGTGRAAYYIVQHGQQPDSLLDFASNPIDGQTDDLVVISGFETNGRSNGRHQRKR